MSGFDGFEGEQRSVGPYVIGRTLGSGMSGKVKLAIHSETGTTVALKCIDRTSLNERQYTNLEREIAAMRALEHPAVLRLYDFDMHASYTRVRGKGERAIVWLALEPAPGGELFDFLMYTGGFDEQSAASYFSQLLGALAAAHAIGISHRDIKPENILLDGNFGLKLADFGLAAIDHDPATGAAQLHRTECGTRSYMAPEILAHQAYDGCKADVWSAGVVAFIMIAGNPPFGQADSRDWWFKAISAGNYERFWKAHLRNVPTFPVGARTFLNRAFVAQPEARASVDELLTSPWLAAAASLGPAELAVKMADRKAVVDREKAAEAEAARKKKEAQRARRAANGGGGRAGGNYDAFARSVNRAAAASLAPPPLLPTGLHEGGDGHGLARYTQFYSCEHADVILEQLAAVCAKLAVSGGGAEIDGAAAGDEDAAARAVADAEASGRLKLRGHKLTVHVPPPPALLLRREVGDDSAADGEGDDDYHPGGGAAGGAGPGSTARSAACTLTVQLYRLPGSGGADAVGDGDGGDDAANAVHVIDVMRKSGEQLDFLRLVHDELRPRLATIIDDTGDDEGDVLVGDGSAAAAAAASEGAGGAPAPAAGEDDLTDDLGMI